MPVGRPSDYDPAICDQICEYIIDGRSLRSITIMDSMPSIATVFKWMRENPAFLKQYEQARAEQVDTFADEMMDIADDGSNDYYENADGKQCVDSEAIQRSKLRVDTRKWIAERMKPKKYGAKSEVEHKGAVVVMPTVKIDGKEIDFGYGSGDTETTESTEQAPSDS